MYLSRLGVLAAVASCGGTCEAPPPSDAGPADSGPDSGLTDCPDAGFLGDPDSPPDLEIIAVQPDGSFVPILDGDEVGLHTPFQGGKVILAGALLTNVELVDCGRLRVGALLRDPTQPGEPAVYNEERHVRYEPMPDRPGWAVPRLINDERNMAPNLESCGLDPYPRDTDGCEWILEVRLEDSRTREILASERLRIMPICPEDDPGDTDVPPELELEQCTCQCAANYTGGRCDKADLPKWIDPPLDCE